MGGVNQSTRGTLRSESATCLGPRGVGGHAPLDEPVRAQFDVMLDLGLDVAGDLRLPRPHPRQRAPEHRGHHLAARPATLVVSSPVTTREYLIHFFVSARRCALPAAVHS